MIKEDPSINLTVSPTVLSGTGGVVSVQWSGYSFAKDSDWLGVYCGDMKPITSSPIKYRPLSTIAEYPFSSGNTTFYLDNLQGAACRIALVNGPAQFLVVKRVSPDVTFSEPEIPLGVRLALAASSDLTAWIRVSWTTRTPGRPIVLVGTSPGKYSTELTSYGMVSTFNQSNLCDDPARSAGWFPPGTLNTAVITGLEPDTQYFYSVGEQSARLGDPAWWSPEASFWTPPVQPQVYGRRNNGTLRFLAFGDMGQAPLDGSFQHSWDYGDRGELNAVNTSLRLHEELLSPVDGIEPSLVVHIGDISYAVGYLTEWSQFLEQVRPVAERMPWMTAIGNHERGSPDSYFPGSDSGGECGVVYSAYYRMPEPAETGTPASPWYSFVYGPVAFVVMSTENNFTRGSPQYQWLASALAAVDRAKTPYLVFAGHRPMYVDSAWDSGWGSDQDVARLLRAEVEPLMINAKVDVAIWGHHHTFQQTCPVANETCTDGAPVHLVIGMAGYDLTHDFTATPAPYIAVAKDDHWGYTRWTVNSTHMQIEFIADDNGSVQHNLAIANRFL